MYNQNKPQQAKSQYGRSQYRPQNLQDNSSSQFTQTNAGTSQYAQNNNYYQASARQGGGVNQFGAHYSSGNRDEDIGNAYYQAQANTELNQNKSQYTGSATLNTLNNVSSNNFSGNQFTTSQYNPQNIRSSTDPQFTQTNAGKSQAQNNNYYQASAGGGVNQFGAQYGSGNRDEDIGNAYYQSTQPVEYNNTANQFNPQPQQSNLNNLNNRAQYAQNDNYYQSSVQQGGGVNQYGAYYTSGNKDEDIGNAYYNKSSQ